MTVNHYDLITVQGDYITVDLLVWRRYRMVAPGVFEKTLDVNPHLAKIHRDGPFLPVGTQVKIPIDLDMLKGAPQPRRTIVLYGRP